MKIQSKILTDFLKTVRMGELEIVGLNFKEEGLLFHMDSLANTHQIYGILNKEHFEEYKPIGLIGVDDLSKLISVLNSMGKELEFEVQGNLFMAKSKTKELSLELVSEKYIPTSRDPPMLDFETSFKLPAEKLVEILNDVGKNKNASIVIQTNKDSVKISTKGKYAFTYHVNEEGVKEGTRVVLGGPFVEAMSGVKDGELTLHVSTDRPIKVVQQTEHAKNNYLVAPRVED